MKPNVGLFWLAVLACGAQSAYCADAAATAARSVNAGFINNGTIHLKPRPSQPPAPVATTITIDPTLCAPTCNSSNSGAITPSGSTYAITPAYGVTSGPNEFFSFSTFNLGTGDIADFSIPSSSITNIVSRVTGIGSANGLQPTNIDGTINSPVNFWFINPAGIILTSHATLNVSGSIALGAADFINFADGTQFFANPSSGTSTAITASTAAPASFGFLPSSQAGSFASYGWNLNVNFTGADTDAGDPTPGLMIAAGSGVSLNNTAISILGTEGSTPFDPALAPISITSNTGDISINNSSLTAGALTIHALNGNVSLVGSPITSTVSAEEATGDITITAPNGNFSIDNASSITSFAGGGGNITITAAAVTAGDPGHLSSGPSIETYSTQLQGVPGNVAISATGAANFYGTQISSFATLSSYGSNGIECGSCEFHSTSGSISIAAASVSANTSDFSASAASTIQGDSIGGHVSLSATSGNVTLTNSVVEASSSGGGGCCGTGAAGYVSIAAAGDITLQSSMLETSITESGMEGSVVLPAAQNPPAPIPGSINVLAGGTLSLNSSAVSSNATNINADAGPISISAAAINILGSQITATTAGTGNAGSINITATGADTAGGTALQITGGSTVTSDANAGQSAAANAGSVTLAATAGSVQVGLATDTSQTTLSSSAGSNAGAAGTVTILSGAGINLGNANLATTAGSSQSAVESATPAAITLTAKNGSGPMTIANSTLDAATSGPQTAGDIDLSGSQIAISNSTLTVSTTGTGNAGNINVIASGADSAGGAALQITGGSTITSDASENQVGANAGTIALTASAGSVQIGLPTDSVQTLVSSSAGSNAGSAGTISVTAGTGIALGNANLATTAGSTQEEVVNATPATINLTANNGSGPVTIANSTLNAATSGPQTAGDIDVNGSQIAISNSTLTVSTTGTGNAGNIKVTASGADSGGGAALQITGGSTITSDASENQVGANAGTISLTALLGSVQIGLPTDPVQTLVSSSAGSGAGTAGTVTVSAGTGIALGNAKLATTAGSTQQAVEGATPGSIKLNANDGAGPLMVANSTLDATSSGPQQAGEIDLSGSQIAVSSSSISSQTTSTANAGNINITGSTVSMVGSRATVATSGSGNAGTIDITASGANAQGVSALQIYGGSAISSDASQGQGGANAGNVTLTASKGSVELGAIADPTQTSVSTSAGANAGSAGTITISGTGISLGNADVTTTAAGLGASATAGTITLTANDGAGPLTVANSTLDATTSGAQQAGAIDFKGSQIAIGNSTLTVSTTGTGDAGNISVTASGADPQGGAALQISGGSKVTSDASQDHSGANAGTVTLTAAVGSVQIGLPTDTTQSVVSSSAGAGAGAAGAITLTAGSGISLGDASLATTAGSTEAAVANAAPATITLTANNGAGPLVVANSTLNATTSGAQQAGAIDLQGSQIAISASTISSDTTSAAAAGNISIAGSTVSMTNTQATVSTTGAGNAGTISVSASGADPAGSAALQIAGGSTISSQASQGQQGANAGNVTLTATNGSVQIGLAADATATVISTSAGSGAGAPGAIMISGAAISLGDATVATTAGGMGSSSVRGTIDLDAGSGAGALSIANSTLDATTSGVQQAGEIDLFGGPIMVTNSSISSSTTGTGMAGDICVISGGASCISGSGAGAVTPRVAGPAHLHAGPAPEDITISNSTLSTDAIGATGLPAGAGSIDVATAGNVTLTNSALLSSTGAYGPAGSVSVSGASVTITGSKQVGVGAAAQTVSLSTSTGGAGSAGDITVTAASGTLALNGAIIESQSTSPSPTNAGAVGTIGLTGDSISITNNSLVSTTSLGNNTGTSDTGTPPYDGGPPYYNGNPPPAVTGPAITIDSTGGTAPLLIADSTVTTQAVLADGANLLINAGGSPLTLRDSNLVASAKSGNGGNITITNAGTTILYGSGILAQATSGNGGAINITPPEGRTLTFVQDAQSLVSASSETGNNGKVTIDAPQTDLNSALAVPDVNIERTPELASNACHREGNRSTFVREGRGGVAANPDGYQTSLPAGTSAAGSQARAVPKTSSPPAQSLAVLAAASADMGCQ